MPTELMWTRLTSHAGESSRGSPSQQARALLLMEGNFNYMKKWIFVHKAINKLYALGFVPGDQYSQKESTAEDT